jgi:hypothetical protein
MLRVAACACAPPIEAMLATAKTEIDWSNREVENSAIELDIAALPYQRTQGAQDKQKR